MTLAEATALVHELAFERADIAALLTASAGTTTATPPVTVFRPYAVAAYLWASARHTSRVLEAEGVVFSNPLGTIKGLLNAQIPLDAGLTIPPAWTVAAMRGLDRPASFQATF